MAIEKNGLWCISTSGLLDDWKASLANGYTNTAPDPNEVVLWRYGSWMPAVSCSGQGHHLIVTSEVKERLAFTRAAFHRVRSLFVTDREVDSRVWPDSKSALAALRDRHDIGEPEEICCPSGYANVPDPKTPLEELRHGLTQIDAPDLWVVFGEPSLEPRRPSMHAVGGRGAGIYCDPFLYRSYVCVEPGVREVLESFGAEATIEFDGLDVEWQ
jgi:hypothetical protein